MANAEIGENRKGNVTEEGWSNAFGSQDSKKFEEMFAEDVVLVASAMAKPVVGRQAVACSFGAASAYYEHCNFVSQAVTGRRTFLEWELKTNDGIPMEGCTIIDRNEQGQIVKCAIHHRPLGEMLLFSRHLQQVTKGVIPEDAWWTPDLFEKTCAKYPEYPHKP